MKRVLKFLHHISIPSHRNNYRAKALHLDFLVVLLGVVTVFSLTTGWLETTGILGYSKDIRVDRLFTLTNEERVSQGLPPLQYNDTLAVAAQNKAQHMFTHDYWAHFGAGKSPWDFILASGYSYEVAGENLGKGYMYSESLFDGWKNSPTHYANIVRPEYDEIGFAVSNGLLQGEEVTLVVQMFGKQVVQAAPVPDKESTQLVQIEEVFADEGEIPVEEPVGEDSEASGVITDEPGNSDSELAMSDTSSKPVVASSFISADVLSLNWTLIIIGFLLSVLFLDLYFAHKLKLVRLTGKNIAHIVFLTSLMVGLMIIKNGVIL